MTEPYRVVVPRRVVKMIQRLPQPVQQRIRVAIELIAADPRPPKAVALRGFDNVLRIRVGDYRIVYEVDDEIRLIAIVYAGHRRDAYRN